MQLLNYSSYLEPSWRLHTRARYNPDKVALRIVQALTILLPPAQNHTVWCRLRTAIIAVEIQLSLKLTEPSD